MRKTANERRASDKPYTEQELRRFNLITLKLSSPTQLHRIEARMDIKRFLEEHGQAKCDAMFAVLKARDKKKYP